MLLCNYFAISHPLRLGNRFGDGTQRRPSTESYFEMQKRIVLGVSVGESFAEFSLLQDPTSFSNTSVLAQKRSYLPREGLKNSLQSFLALYPDQKPMEAIFSLRFLEKILDYRLGGSVAQLVTNGFENWIRLRSQNTSLPPLSSADLLFPVKERMNAQGQVEQALETSELEAIAEKLKSTECKRICIHFLHAITNDDHEKQAAEFFTARGFEVFTPEKTKNEDEVSRWRKNTLNASVSGTFQELKEQILEATKDFIAPEKIYFLSSTGEVFQNESASRLSTLFAAEAAMSRHFGTGQKDILYLGLEKFTLLSGKNWTDTWSSAWGLVENPLPENRELSIQPTSGLEINSFDHLDFSLKNEGWEPGPMAMGRGQKPTFIDLWSETSDLNEVEGLKDRFSAPGQQRFRHALMTLWKTSRQKHAELLKVTDQLKQLSMQTILLEALLHRDAETLLVTGPLTKLFGSTLKKDKSIQILDEDFIEARVTALAGVKALEKLA